MDDASIQFRKQSIKQLENLKPDDIQILTDDTIRENITIVTRPDYHTRERIQQIIEDLENIDLDQYYYSTDQLHITILGGLNITIEDGLITKALNTVLPKFNLNFKLQGIGSNKFASSVNAYPQFQIHELRENLRDIIGNYGDDYTIHLAIYEYMGWINYMRYLKQPQTALLNRLLTYKDTLFGTMKPIKIEAYRNTSKVLDLKKAKLIYSVDL
jgi:hypothetical protein